ncbi:ABC transporter permease [Lacticaseibacillus saniviri JCM 17471 = DSM 24301]|uniref:ABC transporter permease n=1 Tax=Lacticaseibacillus saniviri JCM 17471 = DSM 24301 TaxID=1293598 RepID=A0A0R2MT19_9LACO|nr:ABC transporter permease [Lacticaseibacillus saniviri JCM 17471 = DSM 24301]
MKAHQQQQFKYLRLVFNDHFVLVLIVMLGAALYAYSQFVKNLTQVPIWLGPGLALLLSLAVPVGRLATLVEPADAVFLLPQASAFGKYLLKARRYSLLLPEVFLLLLGGASWPLLQKLGFSDVSGVLTLLVTLMAMKDLDMWFQLTDRYEGKKTYMRRSYVFLLTLVALLLGFWLHPAVSMTIALVADLGFRWQVGSWLPKQQLDYDVMIQREQDRMSVIYRFYNLFTDVPGMNGGVKRRRYLDFLLALVPKKQKNTWRYLYLRGFLRGTEFSGLFVRLTLIAGVLLLFVNQWWLSALLAVLFVYLVGFQLIPFYQQYDEVVFVHLYPLPQGQKQQAFSRLVLVLLSAQVVVLTLISLIQWQLMNSGAILIGGLLITAGMAYWYVPFRLRRFD